MNKQKFANKSRWFLPILLFVVVFCFVLVSQMGLLDSTHTNEAEMAQQAVERAAVLCYATEGFYPPSYRYIELNYGVRVNQDIYLIQYEVFSSNVMPHIQVIKR